MTEALAKTNTQVTAIEKTLIGGDLSELNTMERLSYYKAVCESVGLNPLTAPFQYLKLNNRLVLYAKRDATDQLRKIHSVSIEGVSTQRIEDVFVVTANAKDKEGRTDSSTGAVAIANLKGEALANALMKAETKAKRRVTLSICGLGMLDETEIGSIPDAQAFTEEQLDKSEPVTAAPKVEAKPETVTIRGKVGVPSQTDKGIWFDLNGKRIFAPVNQDGIVDLPKGMAQGVECELEVSPEITTKDGKKKYHRLVKVLAVVEDETTITTADVETLFPEERTA